MKIKDIKTLKTSRKYGAEFTFIRYNGETNTYLYERKKNGQVSWEVVRPIVRKVSGGKVLEIYPPSSDWGNYGITILNNNLSEIKIDWLMTHSDWSPQVRYEFMKSLVAGKKDMP